MKTRELLEDEYAVSDFKRDLEHTMLGFTHGVMKQVDATVVPNRAESITDHTAIIWLELWPRRGAPTAELLETVVPLVERLVTRYLRAEHQLTVVRSKTDAISLRLDHDVVVNGYVDLKLWVDGKLPFKTWLDNV